ncbi:U-box domain-containing protein [Candidatus Protochlamydia sp. W-9]|uniref:U-box domain-containing protein n=1 Tax=Candidatus Protochlamydia sp. W-9 TaxID=1785087 RepID=UPI00096A9A46|nr:U-box domain-containing protein [Candidatus Protochlamydia sp. W-9]
MSINLNSSMCNSLYPVFDQSTLNQTTLNQPKEKVCEEVVLEITNCSSVPENKPCIIGENKLPVEEGVNFRSFNCPITLYPFTDPVVDECGHTFEREAIMEIYNRAIAEGNSFTCPLDPSKILDVSKLIKNYNLADAKEEVDEFTKKHTSEKKTSLGLMKELMQEHKIERRECKTEMQKLISKHEQFLEDFRPLARDTEESLNTSSSILNQCSILKDKNVILEKKVKNLETMGLTDRIFSYLFPRYNDTISGRNITFKEQNDLDKPTITDTEIKAEVKKLRKLKNKIEKYYPQTETK